jgi:heme-degrading monooxygenase HmoA
LSESSVITTSSISTEADIVTLINIFTVEPADQQKLVKVLQDATEEFMRHLPGFVSANIHASLDGTRVVNYAQWKTKGDFEAMFRDSGATKHFQEAHKLAKADPHLHRVVSTHRI